MDCLGVTLMLFFKAMNIQAHVDNLRCRLKKSPATYDEVAAATDGVVSSSWVAKFSAGRMKNPRVDSLIALENALGLCEKRASEPDQSVQG